MEELKKLSLSRILKLELRLLLEKITETLEMFDLDELRMQVIYEMLKRQEVKMQIINEPYGKHPLTDRIAELHTKRLQYASLIYMQIKVLEKVDCKETQQKAKLARVFAKEYLTYLGQKRHYEVSTLVAAFFATLKLDVYDNEREAFNSLGLQPHLDELKKVNDDYHLVFLKRSKDIKDRPATGDLALENETKRMLRMFFEHLSSYQNTFPEINYGPLIGLLNVTLTEYSKLIKTRLATNKRRARKKAEAEKEATEGKDGNNIYTKN